MIGDGLPFFWISMLCRTRSDADTLSCLPCLESVPRVMKVRKY